jgi:hypothetical protein
LNGSGEKSETQPSNPKVGSTLSKSTIVFMPSGGAGEAKSLVLFLRHEL